MTSLSGYELHEELHVVEHGPADQLPVVALVHGSMDRSTSFARVRGYLADLHVVTYDRRGYHRSTGARPAGSLDDHVDDLLEILADRPAVVVGHSLGGVLALMAAVRAPEVVRAVLAYEPPTPWREWWPVHSAGNDAAAAATPGAAAEAFVRMVAGDDAWTALPERTRRERQSEGPALVVEIRALQPGAGPPPFRPEDVGSWCLLACGAESLPYHRRSAEELAGRITDAELAVVAGAAHAGHLTHPERFAELVRRTVAHAGV